MSERTCTAQTKSGEPCKSTPLVDRDVCISHLPRNEKEARGFGGSQPGSGRPRNPRPSEVLREQLAERMDEIIAPMIEGLTATRHLVVGNGPSAHLSEVPDIPTRLRAAAEIFDRLEGKPKQTTELSGPGGGPIEHNVLDVLSDADFNAQVASILDEVGAAGADPA